MVKNLSEVKIFPYFDMMDNSVCWTVIYKSKEGSMKMDVAGLKLQISFGSKNQKISDLNIIIEKDKLIFQDTKGNEIIPDEINTVFHDKEFEYTADVKVILK